MLENGDLIFVREDTEIGQAIQASTGNYSHVAIFLDGLIYHATGEAGVVCQEPVDFFESDRVYDLSENRSQRGQKESREPLRRTL